MILKVIFANSVDPDQTAQGPHCLPVCKNRFEKFARIFSRRHKQRFEKFARIFSRRHKQTMFSDAGFLGTLRVKKELHKVRSKVWNKVLTNLGHLPFFKDFSIFWNVHFHGGERKSVLEDSDHSCG